MPEGFKEFNEVIGLPVHPGTGKETEVFDYQEQRMKFLTRIEQEAKELEINGFLHNSRVQIRLILHHPIHNKSRYL